MIALDTNMLVCALVDDHPEQVAVVRQLIAGNTVFISRTVLLETEWVLRALQENVVRTAEFFPGVAGNRRYRGRGGARGAQCARLVRRWRGFRRCPAPRRLRHRRHAYLRPQLLHGGTRCRHCARGAAMDGLNCRPMPPCCCLARSRSASFTAPK